TFWRRHGERAQTAVGELWRGRYGGDGSHLRVAIERVGHRIARRVEHAEAQRARVAARLARDGGERDMVAGTECGRERYRYARWNDAEAVGQRGWRFQR